MSTLALSPSVTAELSTLIASARGHADNVRAGSTRDSYAYDFSSFERWCGERGLPSLPTSPPIVVAYIEALFARKMKASSIERALAGIAYTQRSAGYPWPRSIPEIAAVMSGIRRARPTAPAQKAPVEDDRLVAMVASLGDDLAGLRDRAILTVGFVGAFRRANLVALQVADLQRVRQGIVVRVIKCKTDQEGRGEFVGLPFASRAELCPVRSLDAWLRAANITEGPLFYGIDRHGKRGEPLAPRAIARIVKRIVERIGLDPALFGAHSLRSGFATTAARRGKSLDAIMRQMIHRSERTTRGYIRHATVMVDNAADGLL